jgi:hypothetical protein
MSSDILLSIWHPGALPPACPYCFRPLGFAVGGEAFTPDKPEYAKQIDLTVMARGELLCASCRESCRITYGEAPWLYRWERTRPREEAGGLRVSDLLRLTRYDDGSWELSRHTSSRMEVPMSYEEIKVLAKELPRIVEQLEKGPVDRGPGREPRHG